MTKEFQESTVTVLNMLKLASIVVVCIGAIAFFIYQTNGLPPRVSKLETDMEQTNKRISEMQTDLSKSSVKQDIIIEDLKIIKAYLLNNNK